MKPLLLLLALSGMVSPLLADSSDTRSWCDALSDSPGLLYQSDNNPWVQSVEVSGRFHYQAAYVEGKDVNGARFNDRYDDYRRFRLGTEIEFLRFFKAEVESNLVEDRRHRDSPPQELDWGHQDFQRLTLEVDLDNLFDLRALDKLELTYGRMKLPVGAELHQSSRHIFTVERSSLSNQISSMDGTPTGVTLSLGKGDWELDLGLHSTDDDAEGLASWNAGLLYVMSLAWEPGDFRFVFDQVFNDPSGDDFGAGYDWVSSLSGTYDADRWGLMVNAAYGDNGGANQGNVLARRQGEFYGVMVMPWLWIVEDHLQWVVQGEWVKGDQSQGVRLGSRYIRARHDNPAIDVDSGRGEAILRIYTGLNWHLCEQNAKIMAGVSHARLSARQGDVSASAVEVAFRTYF